MICSLLLRTCVKPTPFERTTAAMVVALSVCRTSCCGAAPSILRDVGGGVALQPSAYAVPPSSVAGSGCADAVQHLNVAGACACLLQRRPFTSRAGQRAATFGRGSSLWPPRTRIGMDRR